MYGERVRIFGGERVMSPKSRTFLWLSGFFAGITVAAFLIGLVLP